MSHINYKQSIEGLPAVYTLSWQEALLGIALSEHPVSRILPDMVREQNVLPAREVQFAVPGQIVNVCGIVKSCQPRTTKTGNPMMSVVLYDTTGEIKVTVFQKALYKTSAVFLLGAFVMVRGKSSHRPDTGRKEEAAAPQIVGSEEDSEDLDIPGDVAIEPEQEASLTVSYEVVVEDAVLIAL